MTNERAYYVYIYRDGRKAIQYVGYGKSHSRASFHQTGSHNSGVDALIGSGKYFIEIAGPYDSETTARAVEAGLISALAPHANVAKAQSRWRFRPFGVPLQFANRLHEPLLRREDFIVSRGERSIAPVIFVLINETTFDDGRKGYNPVSPPSDPEILERMDRWWQLGRFVEGWLTDPESCPRTLVGIHGAPGAQFIIGAVTVDRRGWHRAEREGAYCQVPTRPTKHLDAHRLRGRRIAADARLKFGPNDNQIFIILNEDGTSLCGSPLSRG